MSCNGLPGLAYSLADGVMRRKDIHTVNLHAVDVDPEQLRNCELSAHIIPRSAKGSSGISYRPASDTLITARPFLCVDESSGYQGCYKDELNDQRRFRRGGGIANLRSCRDNIDGTSRKL